jgi:hypothetical protein
MMIMIMLMRRRRRRGDLMFSQWWIQVLKDAMLCPIG